MACGNCDIRRIPPLVVLSTPFAPLPLEMWSGEKTKPEEKRGGIPTVLSLIYERKRKTNRLFHLLLLLHLVFPSFIYSHMCRPPFSLPCQTRVNNNSASLFFPERRKEGNEIRDGSTSREISGEGSLQLVFFPSKLPLFCPIR